MTEKEALTKWCPFVRTIGADDPGTVNRWTLDEGGALNPFGATNFCIGSACMAFRWMPDVTAIMSGHEIAVDALDSDMLADTWWSGRYAKSDAGYLHRRIAERIYADIPEGMFVDHIDGDPTNNRRGNLRIVSKTENAANAASRGGASQYRGVSPTRNGRWQAQISREGVRMHLGTYDTEEAAAAAYDEAAIRLHGEFARPNLQKRENIGRQGFCGLAGKP